MNARQSTEISERQRELLFILDEAIRISDQHYDYNETISAAHTNSPIVQTTSRTGVHWPPTRINHASLGHYIAPTNKEENL